MAGKADAAGDEEAEQPLSEALLELSDLGRTVDGTGFTYRSLNCKSKRIGLIKIIEGYTQLQGIDLSHNMIKDASPLKGLQFLLKLNLSQNSIIALKAWDNPDEPPLPNLVHLDISGNALTVLPPLPKALRHLNIARNEITSCAEFEGHATLKDFDISENNVKSLDGFKAMPVLTRLDVSGNQLEGAVGLAELPLLEELRLGSNKCEALDGPWGELATLKTLDVSHCQLATLKPLEVLRQLPLLRSLATQENPFHQMDTFGKRATPQIKARQLVRAEVLICHWRLTSLDGENVEEAELNLARDINFQRLTEEQAQKKADAEAAAAAEAAAE